MRNNDVRLSRAIVETGKQLLMRRRSLTAFSGAADLATYLAIIPVAFAG